MPLRKEVAEFQKHCDKIVEIVNGRPDLLTDFERLDIEASVMRIMTALVQIEKSRLPPRKSG
jgi:hypothetical protein